ncbi:MAG: glycosyltransferase [Desulforhopalus sp.]
MNVSYYCQHVLGIGHFHRSIEICRAIARHHPTTLILGGPQVEVALPEIDVLKLPGLQMDSEFQNMVPCNPALPLAEVKTKRIHQLFSHFQTNSPDIFITELYPFGRKAFKFELDPLLEAIRDGSLPDCSCYCSVRDILVEKKTGREKFENRVVQILNSFFDGILVHADPDIITLDETFSLMDDIRIPLHYTGFVTKHEPTKNLGRIRGRLGLSPADKLIVASIGGGNVGSELLFAVIQAFRILSDSRPAHIQLFCGPYCDKRVFNALQNDYQTNINIDRFTDQFPDWLKAADLSISMAGYNTCMNLIESGVPALVYPFKQNREQRLRAERLGLKASITVLEESDLKPHLLAGKMEQQLEMGRCRATINLAGAEETARQLEIWHREHLEHRHHD